jgi:type II secretory pathway component PulF
MPRDKTAYHYKAVSPEGSVATGRIDAGGRADALAKLTARGYRPLRLSDQQFRESFWHRELTPGRRLSLAECQSFCNEMHVLIAAGMEVVDGLSVLLQTLPKRSHIYRLCQSARNSIRLGQSFSEALRLSGYLFPADFIALIKVGEDTAAIDKTLRALSDAYREKLEFEKVLVGALAYPIFLLVIACFVVLVLVLFVAPNLASLFESLDRPVPSIIGAMLWLISFARENVILLAMAAAVGMAAMFAATRIAVLRDGFQHLLYRSPILGEGLRWSSTQRLAATLQLHLARQSPMEAALSSAITASGLPGNAWLSEQSKMAIRQGKGLSQVIGSIPLIPKKAARVIAVGEAGGRLSEVLEIVIAESRMGFERRMALFSSLLSPLLIVVVGTLVGTMIFGVFSALMSINDAAF